MDWESYRGSPNQWLRATQRGHIKDSLRPTPMRRRVKIPKKRIAWEFRTGCRGDATYSPCLAISVPTPSTEDTQLQRSSRNKQKILGRYLDQIQAMATRLLLIRMRFATFVQGR